MKRWSLIANLLAFAILGLSLSKLTMTILEIILSKAITEVKPKEIKVDNKRVISAQDLEFIWKSNIFGKSKKEENIQVEPEQIVIPISSSFSLLGTIVGDKTKTAMLKIISSGETGFFDEGEVIDGQAKLEKVERNLVIISRNGVKEMLYLFEEKDAKTGAPIASIPQQYISPPPPSYSYPSNQPSPIIQPGGPTAVQVRRIGENSFEVRKDNFSQAINNIGSLLTQARAIPYIIDGKIEGFRLISITPGSLYDSIGIRNGDIIKNINGVPISSPETALRVFSDLKNESQFRVEVVREGRNLTLSYILR